MTARAVVARWLAGAIAATNTAAGQQPTATPALLDMRDVRLIVDVSVSARQPIAVDTGQVLDILRRRLTDAGWRLVTDASTPELRATPLLFLGVVVVEIPGRAASLGYAARYDMTLTEGVTIDRNAARVPASTWTAGQIDVMNVTTSLGARLASIGAALIERFNQARIQAEYDWTVAHRLDQTIQRPGLSPEVASAVLGRIVERGPRMGGPAVEWLIHSVQSVSGFLNIKNATPRPARPLRPRST
jgi:hypothetical protein